MNILILIILSIAVLAIFLLQLSNIISIIFGSPYVKLDHKILNKALKSLDLNNKIYFELGSGDGEGVKLAASRGAKAFGFEISPWPYLISKIRTVEYPNAKIIFQNIKTLDYSKADVIYCYLLPELIKDLEKNFSKIKKEALIISIDFPINYLNEIKNEKYLNHTIRFYKKSH